MKRILKAWMAAGLCLAAAACGSRSVAPEPKASEFAPYIKAYTGGMVPENAELRVDLTEDAAGENPPDLFQFEPPVEGTVRWNNPASVSFIPADGALKAGQAYKATFHLEKLREGAPAFVYPLIVKGPAVAGSNTVLVKDNGRSFRVEQLALKDGLMEVTLSQAPVNASLRGLVEVDGAARSYTQVQDRLLLVFFEGGQGDLTLTLDGALRNAAGETLGEAFTHTFQREEPKPAVEVSLKGGILPEKDKFYLPFRAVSLSAVEVRVVKIYEKNILTYLQDNDLSTGGNALRRSGRLVYRGDVQLDPSKDLHKWNDFSIDLSGLIKKEPGAIYRVRLSFRQDQSLYGGAAPLLNPSAPSGPLSAKDQAIWDKPSSYYWDNDFDWNLYNWEDADDPTKPSYYMDTDRFPVVQLLASDIGLVAEYAGGNQLWVATTDLITGEPLPGAKLEVFDYQLQCIGKGKTDGKGLATLTVEHQPFAIVAKAGGSTAYLKTVMDADRSLSRFDVGGETVRQGLKAFIYGERGVWRPGDTLHVNMLLSDKGRNLPEGHPATLELYTPEGQFHSRMVRTGKDGFFTYNIPTRDTDPTGYWNAYFKVGGSSFHKILHIETIKPNRLKIHVDYPSVLEAGLKREARIAAEWLTGGAAGGAKAHAQLTLRRRKGAPFQGFEAYTFDNPASKFQEAQAELFTTWLDGTAELRLPEAADAPGMLEAFVVTSVEEKGGDESFTTQTLPFSPYSAYVGIKLPKGEYLETDKTHSADIAVVDAKGRPVKGHALEYVLYKVGWNWWWDIQGDGLDTYVNGNSVKVVKSGVLTSAIQDVTVFINIPKDDWGRYLLLVRDRESGHISGQTFLADWPDYEGRAGRRDPETLTMLSFSTDKTSYTVGEQATVYIPAAPGARALVSLENAGGVVSREWVELSDKDTPWRFAVTQEMAPNIYVHITLVQPYGNTVNDLPLRLYGVQRVRVENPGSKLVPQIQMPDKLHPEEVDEGLLDLTAFKTPDPWARMNKVEALGVATWDLYDDVVGARNGRLTPLSAIGGDEDAVRSARKDNRFNPVVLCFAPRTVAAKGTDVVKVKLPQYVGSVRVMVVAAHDGAFGSAQKTVPVQSPLMVISTLPRQLGCGEEVAVPVNVFALEESVKDVAVTIEADGPVELPDRTERVHFTSTGDQLVCFKMKALAQEGVAHVKVTATAAGHKASEEIALPVVQPQAPVTRVERFTLAAGASRKVSGGQLQVSAFPVPDAHGLYAAMRDYPYDCTEQLSARGLTLVNLLPQLNSVDSTEACSLMPGIIARLYARQNADGGFAYWGGGKSDSWVSSMAGILLVQAQKAGFEVNDGVVKAWKAYQEKLSQAYRIAGNSLFSQADEAYRLYSLAVAGASSQAGMNRLREGLGLTPQAQWLLASAYALSGKTSTANAILNSVGRDFPEYSPYNLTYGSATRDRFAALEALVLCGRMGEAMSLAQELPLERTLSTQESAFAAVALARLFRKVPTREAQTVLDNGVLTNNSEGTVYVTLATVSREALPASANGLGLEVSYVDADGVPVNPAALKQGTRFTARINVQSKQAGRDLQHLALSLNVPSGWEIVNDRMAGGAEDGYDHKDIRDNAVRWYFALPAGRFKTFSVQLRAAYEGQFVLPATTVEAMYEPGVAASTAPGSAVVLP